MFSSNGYHKLQIGLIGAGRIVETIHLPMLTTMPSVQVVGIYDPQQERAAAMARQFGVPTVCRSHEELLQLDLDAVLVACPNIQHAPMTLAALAAGKHVICEKPMATTYADALAMVAMAAVRQRTLLIAFPNRYHAGVMALHKAVAAGQLGAIRSIHCGWLRRQGIPGRNTWFTHRALSGGGALIDLGSHLFDLAFWLGGNPPLAQVLGTVDEQAAAGTDAAWYQSNGHAAADWFDVEVGAEGFIRCVNGLAITVEVSWDAAVPQDRTYLHIRGSAGSAVLETLFGFSPNGQRPADPLHLWWPAGESKARLPTATDPYDPYRAMWHDFIDLLQRGEAAPDRLADHVATVQAIEALYQAAGQPQSSAVLAPAVA